MNLDKSSKSERMRILEMIENGQVSVEQGLQMLGAVADENQPVEPVRSPSIEAGAKLGADGTPIEIHTQDLEEEATKQASDTQVFDSPSPAISIPDSEKWRRFWVIPLWVGVAITVLGGWLMFKAMQDTGIGVSFIFAALPFAIGLMLVVFAWGSRTAPWLHLRVQQEPGEWPQRIAFSFPLPMRTAAWFVRRFKHRVPNLDDTALEDLILALDESTSPENPIYIEVDEGDKGEKVEIYIG